MITGTGAYWTSNNKNKEKPVKKKFNSTLRKGFNMTFENGLTISVQWGAGNYCDNHDNGDFTCRTDARSDTAEIAVLYNGEFLDIDQFLPEGAYSDGTVCGWLSPEEVLYAMNKVQAFNPNV